MTRPETRAQAASIDGMIAITLFLAILAVFFIHRAELTRQSGYPFSDMAIRATTATDYLLNSPGVPANWTASDVQVVGLTHQAGRIDPDRLAAFMALSSASYENATTLLGLSPFSVQFTLAYLNGTPVAIQHAAYSGSATFGTASGLDIVVVRRVAMLGADVVALEVRAAR